MEVITTGGSMDRQTIDGLMTMLFMLLSQQLLTK